MHTDSNAEYAKACRAHLIDYPAVTCFSKVQCFKNQHRTVQAQQELIWCGRDKSCSVWSAAVDEPLHWKMEPCKTAYQLSELPNGAHY